MFCCLSDKTAESVSAEEAIKHLWPQCFYLPSESEVARCFGALASLTAQVDAWSVSRPKEWSRLPDVVERMMSIVSQPSAHPAEEDLD